LSVFSFKIFRFPNVSSNQPLPSINENPPKPNSRSRTTPQVQSTPNNSNKSTRIFQTNLEPIDEKNNVVQPTEVDIKRDIQILTLNDDENPPNQQTTIEEQNEVPF